MFIVLIVFHHPRVNMLTDVIKRVYYRMFRVWEAFSCSVSLSDSQCTNMYKIASWCDNLPVLKKDSSSKLAR